METAIVSIICIFLIVVGGMTMSQSFLSSVDSTTLGVEGISDREGEIMRTELSLLGADVLSGGNTLEVALRNSGQVKLTNFDKWDVIVEYNDGFYIRWLPYVDGKLGGGEWTVKGIYLNADSATAEVFEPGILNPGEEMVIEAEMNPKIDKDTTGTVVISTPSGIPASVSFTN